MTEQVLSKREFGAVCSVLLRRSLNDDGTVDMSVVGAIALVVQEVIGLSRQLVPVNTAKLVRETKTTATTFRRALRRAEALGLIEREAGREGSVRRGFVRLSDSVVDDVLTDLEAEES
ncbi:hypothetical protein [Nesterenkonia aerolata]|uniref:Uncharacterized protein n=1 Tax=Nesterenkonia aerolata TaxID=3074079 RepID=A0ABU2DRC0_9MICC|nr:hypothetical protein [Nesterenkonia sp. LY-0111]MDR8018930.1 hypothetical protein [Nesterenkonia sp. LY-0111]